MFRRKFLPCNNITKRILNKFVIDVITNFVDDYYVPNTKEYLPILFEKTNKELIKMKK